MTVGIVSIIDYKNYGNQLQNYALQTFLKIHGYQATTVMHSKDGLIYNTSPFNLKNIIKYIINWHNQRNECGRDYVKSGIRQFNIKKFSIHNIDIEDNSITNLDLKNEFNFFIVGSDQVWNPLFWDNKKECAKRYFLQFAERHQRIAYAASFGISTIPRKYIDVLKVGLNSIPFISVREKAGADIVKKLTGKDVPVLVDPTLLLSDDVWRNIEMCPDWYKDEKYILTYFLGNVPNVLSELAKKNNYKIFNLMDSADLNLYVSRVEEFLWLIDHAELVCTDSFHACVFSIIFNTPFVVVKRQQRGVADMTSRLDTLLELFGYQERLIEDDKVSIEKSKLMYMDFSKVKDIQKQEISRSMDFLKNAMNIK